ARTHNQRRNRLDALRVLFRDVTDRVYWFALGTNDYGLDRWSAAEFGAALATWLDELHAALPGVHVVIQSPTPRTDESGLNDDDLPAFRAQMEAVADARTEWTTYVDGSTLCDVEFVSSAFPNDVGQ